MNINDSDVGEASTAPTETAETGTTERRGAHTPAAGNKVAATSDPAVATSGATSVAAAGTAAGAAAGAPAGTSVSAPRIGIRSTRQRKAVIAAMTNDTSFRPAKDIHQILLDRGDQVGLTTVYRTLQALAEVKAVDVLHNENGEALYRLCSDHHHHHLVCTDCGDTVEIGGGPVEQWAGELAERHGYRLTGHTAEVFGLCGECQDD